MDSSSLEMLSREINVRLEKAKQYRKAASEKANPDRQRALDHRISAGKLLIEARDKIKSGECGNISFAEWLRENVQRSKTDCYRVMKIAGDDDPETALELERKATREQYSNMKNSMLHAPLEELVLEYNDLPSAQQAEFLRRIGALRLPKAA
jgi:hypothetical protein